jgi:hypothetical protein
VQAGSLDWLKRYQPVAIIGKTVRLYYVPDVATERAPSRVDPRPPQAISSTR